MIDTQSLLLPLVNLKPVPVRLAVLRRSLHQFLLVIFFRVHGSIKHISLLNKILIVLRQLPTLWNLVYIFGWKHDCLALSRNVGVLDVHSVDVVTVLDVDHQSESGK